MQEFRQIVNDLASSDAAIQIPAVEHASDACHELVRAAVSALERGPHRFLVAERLHRFGTIAVPLLEELLVKTDEMEPRVLAGIVLLQLGSNSGVFLLLKVLEAGDPFAGLVAAHLVKANVPGAVDAILRRLRSNDAYDIDATVLLLLALKDSGVTAPPDIINRFSGIDVPWQIRSLVRDFSSNGSGSTR